MRLKGSGPSLRALTLDGDPLDVADMTPQQRAAFERFAGVERPARREAVTS